MTGPAESTSPFSLSGHKLPQAPYRGIESFRFIDELIFCARSVETRKLVRSVTVFRGVLLYGASGSGKSSLINAGLMPELIRDGFFIERIRVQPIRDEEMIIERISLTPEGTPPFLPSLFAEDRGVRGLRGFLEKILAPISPQAEAESRIVLSVSSFLAALHEKSRDRPTLLIFDQFEEFVTLFEEAPQVQSLQEARAIQAAILEALVALLRDHSLPVKLLFAFREDYLARLGILFRKCPDLTDQYLRLTPPDRAALLDIVRGPFRLEEARRHFGRELSDEVADALAIEMDKRGENDLLNLSEVEVVCARLWHSDNPSQLLKSRGAQGLLEDYLAEELDRLQNLRDPAVALLSRMVTSNGTRNVISEADLLPQIAKEEKLPMQDLADALRILEKDTRLVRREQRNKVYFYEIVSEFLVPWIFRQKELRESTRERGAFRRKVIGVSFLIFLLGVVAWAWQVKTFRETNLYIQLSTTQKNLEEERGVFKQKEKAQAEEIDRKSKMLRQIENSLRAEILQLESSIVDLNSREGAAKERISELVEGLKEEDQQTTQLHVSLQNQQAENARIQEQATHLQQDLLIEQTENTRLGQQLGQLQQTVQSEQTDNARLGQQVEQLQNGVQERQTENATLRRQTDQLQREVTEAKNSAQERLTRIEQLRAELGQMKVDVATCRTSKDGLNELFEQTKTELETCRAQSGSSTSPPP